MICAARFRQCTAVRAICAGNVLTDAIGVRAHHVDPHSEGRSVVAACTAQTATQEGTITLVEKRATDTTA